MDGIIMNKSELVDWKEKLKIDLYFSVNVRLYIMNFHEETNGIAIRKSAFTKTFKHWLLKKEFGALLWEEIERRMKNKKRG